MSNLPKKKPLLDVEVYERDGQPLTTSLEVARVFGKEHKDVLRSIENLECSQEFSQRNFAPTSRTDKWNREQPMYELTKNGLVFLTMGFTGKKAADFKEAYIEAFDAMEEHIRDQRMTISDLHKSLEQTAAVVANIGVKVSEEFERQDKKIDHLGFRQDNLEKKFGALQFQVQGVDNTTQETNAMTKEIDNTTKQLDDHRRKAPGKKVQAKHLAVIRDRFNGMCPACLQTAIAKYKLGVGECGYGQKIGDKPGDYVFIEKGVEFDHWIHRGRNGETEVWPVCPQCNKDRQTGELPNEDIEHQFRAYINFYKKYYVDKPKAQARKLQFPVVY